MKLHKRFISAQELLEDSFRLASIIHADGYVPDLIVALWRGGTPIGIAIQEYYEYKGYKTDHIAIRTSSYTGIARQSETIRVYGLQYILDNATPGSRLLLVDDTFDSGRSLAGVIRELDGLTGGSNRGRIRIACPWYKPGNNRTQLTPDYYLHQTADWLVFPHELVGLTEEEIQAGKPGIAALLK